MTADSHHLLLLSLGQHKRCGKGNTSLPQDEAQTLSVKLFQKQETGIVLLGELASGARMISVALILAGIVGLKLSSA